MACSRVRSDVEKISMNIRSGVREGGQQLLQLRIVGDGVVQRGIQRWAPEDAGGRGDGLEIGRDDVLGLVLNGRIDGVYELVLAHLPEGNGLAQRPGLRAQHQLIAPRGFGQLDLGRSPARYLVGENAVLAVERAQLEVPVEHEVDGLAVFGDLHVVDEQIARGCDEVESQDVGSLVEDQRCAFVMTWHGERMVEGEQSFLIPSDVADGSLRSWTSHRPIQLKRVAIRSCCSCYQQCQDYAVHVQKSMIFQWKLGQLQQPVISLNDFFELVLLCCSAFQAGIVLAPQEHQQVLVQVHHHHHQVAHQQGHDEHELRLLVERFGAHFSGTEAGEDDEEGVVAPDEDEVERVEGVRVERLAEGLGHARAQHNAQIEVVAQHEQRQRQRRPAPEAAVLNVVIVGLAALLLEKLQGEHVEYEAELGEELDEQLSEHGEDVAQGEEGVGRELPAEQRGRLGEVDGDEDGEGDEEVLVERLVGGQRLVVHVEDHRGGQLDQREEDHHPETVQVRAQSCPADPQAVHDAPQARRAGVETGEQGAVLALQLQRQVSRFVKRTTPSHRAADLAVAFQLVEEVFLVFDFHLVENDGLLEQLLGCGHLALHEQLLEELCTQADLGATPELLKLCQKLREHLCRGGLPLDVPLADHLLPVFGHCAEQQFVLGADAVEHGLRGRVQLPLLAHEDDLHRSAVELADGRHVILRLGLLQHHEAEEGELAVAHVLREVKLVVRFDREGPHRVGVQDEALLGHIHDVLEGVFGVGVGRAVLEHFFRCALEEDKLL